jgi:hypothetical protein
MIRRALLLVAIAALYVAYKRRGREIIRTEDQRDDARWANEGGANAPSSV